MTHDLRSDDDRARFFKSVSAAVLIASVGFGLTFLLFAWLPWQTLNWLGTLPPKQVTPILSVMSILARAVAVLAGLFASLMPALLTRRRGSKPRHPAQSI
ncbi:MAG: hypothetical protein WBQ94_14675 [Terracidiphilus sp.]